MENLNEDNIKRSTLRFLKGYYKYRPRKGETEATVDNLSEGGIIADGLLAFTTEDDQRFVSTFEATSNDTKSEVTVKVLYRRLAWDGFALASTVALTWLIWEYTGKVDFFEEAGYWWIATIIMSIILSLVLVFVLVFSQLKRYRYIYAVEQFKRYFADEQWISIGEDVFPNQDDKDFIELKDQCIRNGFGLIKVAKLDAEKDLNPQLIITPSRKDTFKKKRQMVQFVGTEDFSSRIRNLTKMSAFKWMNALSFTQKRSGAPLLENMLRFRGKNVGQKAITFSCLAIIAGIFVYELTKSDFQYVNETTYPQLMIDSLEGKSIESGYSAILDTMFLLPYDSSAIPYLELYTIAEQSDAIAAIRKRGQDVVVSLPDRSEFLIYDCSRLNNITEEKYIIEDGVFPSIEVAIERMKDLKSKGIMSTALWLGCFSNQPLGYSVYFGNIQNNEDEASLAFSEYRDKLKELERVERQLKIRMLTPN